MNEIEDLTETFRSLGAKEPEAWASSQINEGINQLGRYLFLREAWKSVLGEDDHSWIDAQIAYANRSPDAPNAGIGKSLERILESGCARADVTSVARGIQYELLFDLCYLLNDAGDLEEIVQDMSWALFQTDDDGNPVAPIDGLHESVLETDPTGREMRPIPDPAN